MEKSSPSTSRTFKDKAVVLSTSAAVAKSNQETIASKNNRYAGILTLYLQKNLKQTFKSLDGFNLCGLSSQVPYYEYALDLILDVESSHGVMVSDMFTKEQNELVESAAEMLYGLIHRSHEIYFDKQGNGCNGNELFKIVTAISYN
nr:putative casein kinase II subunit beta-4 isoform X6 [Ipomoea batatas]